MHKSLDQKLAAIHADPAGCREFIIADAKDADMAFGMAAPGQSPEYYGQEGRFRSLDDYRRHITEWADWIYKNLTRTREGGFQHIASASENT